jgi:adenylate cyclase
VPGEAKEADEVKAPEAAASAEAVTAESAGAEEAAEGAPELKERKVKYSLQLKLVAIIAVLLFVSLGTITTLVSALVSSDVQLTAEVNNFSINRRVAESMSNEFKNIRSAVASFLNDVSVIEVRNPGKGEELTSYFFQRQPNISAIALVSVDSGARHLLPSPLRSSVSVESMNTWLASETEDIERARMGETLLRNASPFFGLPQLVMLLPVSISVNDAPPGSFCAAVFFSQGHITAMLGSGANISFAVNDDADVIVHGDPSLVLGGANFGQIPFIANALSSAGNGPQTLYTDENGVKYFGIYQRLVIGDVGVITIIRRSDVFSGIMATTNRNIIISVFVFLLSILIISVFARTMSVPLRLLTVAARKIEQGEYQLGLTHDSQDEIGALTRSFVSMGHGLENFEKFTNKAVVKLARRGKLSRGGVTKKITVSFVLIRDFGEISRKMNATQIVAFVNEYLELMVPCITATGGIVDKFLTQGGVIIMALWGSIDSAGSPEDDAFNCISSMMMIRACLMDFNEELQSRFWGYAPLIKIGCGINSGEVVAGQMGSESRMEYTVIGDTVNLAARLEGANDVFDTDILISENTWNLVKDKILVQEMQNIEVKGKAKPLRVFSVINMRDLHDAAELFEKLAVQRNKRQEDGKRVLRYFAATMEDVRALWRSALAE